MCDETYHLFAACADAAVWPDGLREDYAAAAALWPDGLHKTAPEELQIVLQPQQTADTVPEAPVQTDAPEEQTEPEAPAQEETAFPMPTGSMFGLMGRQAVLFDAAVTQKYPREDTTIVIPSLRVYGSFEENGKTDVICDLHYDFYWDYTGADWEWNAGGMTKLCAGGAGDAKRRGGLHGL